MPEAQQEIAGAIVTDRPKKNGAAGGAKKSTLTKLLARATTTERGGTTTLRRRRMMFTVAHDVCDVGAFDEDFELVLESPSTEVELAAIKKYGQENPGYIPHEMCRLCIVEVDGQRVSDTDLTRDALWEALGSKGRALVTYKWNELSGGGNDQAAVKKAADTTRLLI